MKIAKDVWSIDEGDLSYEDEAMRAHAKKMIFPIGEPNDKFAQYFTGKSLQKHLGNIYKFFEKGIVSQE